MVAVLGYSKEQIRSAVRDMYTLVATRPTARLHFPVGREACTLVGYSDKQVCELPAEALESFAGVGCPFHAGVIEPGHTVLDIGAGSGTDVLIAARLVGDQGKVWALDLTPAMRQKLEKILDEHQITNVMTVDGDAENIPLADASVDVVTTNGVLNLVPDKRRAIGEIFRVLKPGGHLQLADIVIATPVTPDCEDDPQLWAECVVGATVDESYLTMFRDAGFEYLEVLRDYDYFANSPSEDTRQVARQFGAHALELRMRRGRKAPLKLVQWAKRLDPRRLAASVQRRGLWGVLALASALLACYGTLAIVGLLSLLGISLAIDNGIWAGVIVALALLTTAIIAVGSNGYRSRRPLLVATAGAAALAYTMFADYHAVIELVGFALLATATYLDFDRRRWARAQRSDTKRASPRPAVDLPR